jgi:hypothetical protein
MFSPRRGFTTTKAQTLIYDAWEAEGVQDKFRLCEEARETLPFPSTLTGHR